MGRSIVSSFQVVEHVPGKGVRIRTIESSIPLAISREVSAEGSASRVTAVVQGEPSGAMRLFNPLMKIMVKRSFLRDYGRLKEIFEKDIGGG